jgi:hypothetical protein
MEWYCRTSAVSSIAAQDRVPEAAATVLRTVRELLGQPRGPAADAGYRRMAGRTGATVQCLPGLGGLPATHTSRSWGPADRRIGFASW